MSTDAHAPRAESFVALSDLARFGPCLRQALYALQARALVLESHFCPTDADVALQAAVEVEELMHMVGLGRDASPQGEE